MKIIQVNELELINTDFGEKLVWTGWRKLSVVREGENAKKKLAYWRTLNDYAVSERAKRKFRIVEAVHHVFKFTDWFMNRQEEWDCDFQYLVFANDEMLTLPRNSKLDKKSMRKQFPKRIEYEAEMSRHRGRVKYFGKDLNDLPRKVLEFLSRGYHE